MATSAVVPVSEYLRTVYRPDCDYVDGEIQERNLGELDHSYIQARLLDLLRTPANKLHIQAIPEVRVQISPTRFRVPDVCVLKIPVNREQVIRTPPLLCIEILSPEDRMSRFRERIRDCLDMGVREVWTVDPGSRSVLVYAGSKAVETASGTLMVPETPVEISVTEIFSALDEK